MAGSLLTFLAPQIKMPQEDIATISLCHIIGQSAYLMKSFTKVLCTHLSIPLDESICFYKTQSIGEEKDRPDIVGFDGAGKEVLICEAKFYAALTENQPNGYLDRLRKSNGKGLIFLCPENRITGLWNQLYSIVKNDATREGDYCVLINEIKMGIISWEELLGELKKASDHNGKDMIADIQELEVFCEEKISKAFIPFSQSDLGADVAISQNRYYQVLDQTRDILLTKKDYYGITQGTGKRQMRSTPRMEGYAIYMASNICNIDLYFDRDAWAQPSSIITPFWLGFDLGEWNQGGKLAAYLNTFPAEQLQRKNDKKAPILMIALDPPIGLTRDESAQFLANQVLHYLDEYKAFTER